MIVFIVDGSQYFNQTTLTQKWPGLIKDKREEIGRKDGRKKEKGTEKR